MKLPAVLLLAVGLVACQPAKIELTVVDYGPGTGPETGPEAPVWDLIRAQTKDLADLKVEVLGDEAFDRRLADTAQKFPDVVFLWPGARSATLQSQHRVKDLLSLIPPAELQAFVPAALDPRAQAGGVVGELPGSLTATHVFYANLAVLGRLGLKPPATYAELKAQVPVLRAAGLEVVLMANKEDWVMESCLFSTLVGRLAGPDFSAAVQAGKSRFTDPAFVAALQVVQDLYADGVLSRTSLQTTYGDIPGSFAAGRAAYLIDSDWRVGSFLTDPATKTALLGPEAQKQILMTVFPAVAGEVAQAPRTSVQVGPGYGISSAVEAGSAREKAAVAAVLILQGREAQQKRLDAGTSVPTRNDLATGGLEPLAQARLKFYTQITGTAVLDGVLAPRVIAVLNTGLHQIAWGVSSPKAVAEAVQKAFDETRS